MMSVLMSAGGGHAACVYFSSKLEHHSTVCGDWIASGARLKWSLEEFSRWLHF